LSQYGRTKSSTKSKGKLGLPIIPTDLTLEINLEFHIQVVLASTPDMECGFSRELFLQWCTNPQNSIILTSRTSPGTLARDLVERGGNRNIMLDVKRRVRLEGIELEEYQRREKLKQEQMKQEQMYVYIYIYILFIFILYIFYKSYIL